MATVIASFILLVGAAPTAAVPNVAAAPGFHPPASTLLRSWASTHTVTTLPETSKRIVYRGRWTAAANVGYLGGLVRASNQPGARATITFSGTAISWIGPVGPTRGTAKVYLDGGLVRTVNTHAARFARARSLFTMTFNSAKTRTLQIVVSGSAGHPTVAIDAIAIRGTARSSASPTATPSATSGTYAAVFGGDATGGSDVTASLQSFLQAHNGQRVALATNGTYRVGQLSFTASNLTVDFRGARIQGSQVGARGILRVQTSSNVTLNDPTVYGTGYAWDPNNQNEHGIQIDGGSNITLNHPVVRTTRGDGIYVSYQSGKNSPPVGVVINNADIERASRNGIAPVAGQVTIRGGHISQVGLHGIDFEVNDDVAANSIAGIVDGIDIRRHGDLPGIESSSYAVAAGGYSSATKKSMVIQNVTGDVLRMTIRNTASVTITVNTSDTSTTADFPGSSSVTFTSNTRISRI